MLPACLVIATVAMFSGISGAALLTPVFLIAFPLIGVPRLGTVAAIGTSPLLEISAPASIATSKCGWSTFGPQEG